VVNGGRVKGGEGRGNFDVDKLERLVAMQEAPHQRNCDQLFNEACRGLKPN